jgi:hypothetical protein
LVNVMFRDSVEIVGPVKAKVNVTFVTKTFVMMVVWADGRRPSARRTHGGVFPLKKVMRVCPRRGRAAEHPVRRLILCEGFHITANRPRKPAKTATAVWSPKAPVQPFVRDLGVRPSGADPVFRAPACALAGPGSTKGLQRPGCATRPLAVPGRTSNPWGRGVPDTG